MKLYSLMYKDNDTREVREYEFEAKGDAEAYLIAYEFCNNGWHKFYGVRRV